jgi:hypothetical protein
MRAADVAAAVDDLSTSRRETRDLGCAGEFAGD